VEYRAALALVCDPATAPEVLRAIAAEHGSLREAIAEHPRCRPGVLDGLPAVTLDAPLVEPAAPLGAAPVATGALGADRADGVTWGAVLSDDPGWADALAEPEAAPPPALPFRRRHPVVTLAAAVLIVLALAGAGVGWWLWQESLPLTTAQFQILGTQTLPQLMDQPLEQVDSSPGYGLTCLPADDADGDVDVNAANQPTVTWMDKVTMTEDMLDWYGGADLAPVIGETFETTGLTLFLLDPTPAPRDQVRAYLDCTFALSDAEADAYADAGIDLDLDLDFAEQTVAGVHLFSVTGTVTFVSDDEFGVTESDEYTVSYRLALRRNVVATIQDMPPTEGARFTGDPTEPFPDDWVEFATGLFKQTVDAAARG
jgi:hypothetical protein